MAGRKPRVAVTDPSVDGAIDGGGEQPGGSGNTESAVVRSESQPDGSNGDNHVAANGSGETSPTDPVTVPDAGPVNRSRGPRGPYKPRTPRGEGDEAKPRRHNRVAVGGPLLARKIGALHELVAKFTGLPVQLSEVEANDLAEAVSLVSAQYNVVVNPKVVALLNLAGTAAAIYAPRVAMVIMASRMNQPPPGNHSVEETIAAAAGGNVVDMKGEPAGVPTPGGLTLG